MGELGVKGGTALSQLCFEVPIAAALEGAAGPFPLHQQPHGHGLDPSGTQAPGDLLPEQRGEGVTHQAIEDPPGFLGMDELHIELSGLLQGATDGLLGDLVEDHPLHRHLRVEQLQQVPADRFPFPVFVGRQ